MKRALLLVAVLFIAVSGLTSCSGIDPWRLQGTWEASVTVGETTTITHRLVIEDNTFGLAADMAAIAPIVNLKRIVTRHPTYSVYSNHTLARRMTQAAERPRPA